MLLLPLLLLLLLLLFIIIIIIIIRDFARNRTTGEIAESLHPDFTRPGLLVRCGIGGESSNEYIKQLRNPASSLNTFVFLPYS